MPFTNGQIGSPCELWKLLMIDGKQVVGLCCLKVFARRWVRRNNIRWLSEFLELNNSPSLYEHENGSAGGRLLCHSTN